MARGLLSGVVFGSLVSIAGLGVASLVAPLPGAMPAPDETSLNSPQEDSMASDAAADSEMTSDAGMTADTDTPIEAETPVEDDAMADGASDMAEDQDQEQTAEVEAQSEEDATAEAAVETSSPVGSLEIAAPQAPEVPTDAPAFGVADVEEDIAEPIVEIPEVNTPATDTDPLDEPVVASIEGSMEAPEVPDSVNIAAQPVEPVLPNPLATPPQTPESETDLTVSTRSDVPQIVIIEDDGAEPIADDMAPQETEDDFFVVDLAAPTTEPEATEDPAAMEADASADADQSEQPVDVVEPATPESSEPEPETTETAEVEPPQAEATDTAQTEEPDAAPVEDTTGTDVLAAVDTDEPRVQLQGSQNALLDDDRETGVTVNRPTVETEVSDTDAEQVALPTDALNMFAADAGNIEGKSLMSIVLIDDGSMSAASAALAGIPFPVTIALDPALPNAADLMTSYREAGFEVAVLAKLPEGALPIDVEITFESIFRTLPETVAVLDIGAGGLQGNRDVTQQAMSILADQGRGYVSISEGLNTAGRAADAAGVPAVEVFRDLDSEGQDARVIRRFVDNAAFRARQESGVVLVGRVRPDTISALILWGATVQDELTALVPVTAILNAQ